ncbi:asparagine synthase-related protein [Nocardioides sp.]|uniref:asparagine synthase-related protein n=1 Tax=Nocardioides sp. TaxID=35761 RepID=UPI003516F436
MSALSLLFHHDGGPADAGTAAAMAATSRFDGDRDATITDGPLALHATLTAWTPEQVEEVQPARTPAGVLVVLDGHLDDRERLAHDLGLVGPLPADVDLAAHAVHRWGDDAAQHLVGSFVLLTWEPRAQRLVVTRGALASRGVYWHHDGRTTRLATRPRALWAAGVRREVDLETLADFMLLLPPAPGAAMYRGLRLLEPGSRLVLDHHGVREEVWWQWPEQRSDLHGEELVDVVDDLLQRCVADAMRRTGGLGALLSGGLDSSTVTAMALGMLPDGVRLHSATEVAPEGSGPNHEQHFVEALAARYPALDPAFVVSDRHLLDDYDAQLDAAEMPTRNTMNAPWLADCVRSAAARGVTVMLVGDAGNLTFSRPGDTGVADALRRGRVLSALSAARTVARVEGRRVPRVLAAEAIPLLGAGPARGLQTFQYTGRWRDTDPAGARLAVVREEFVLRTRVEERARARGLSLVARDVRPDPDRWRRVLATSVRWHDQRWATEARFGVQQRDPTADRRLVELAATLPDRAFRVGERPRGLAREVAARHSPRPIWDRPGRGLQSAGWLTVTREGLPALRAELQALRRSDLAASTFDLDAAGRLLDQLGAEDGLDVPVRNRVERVFGVGRWLRRLDDGGPGSA